MFSSSPKYFGLDFSGGKGRSGDRKRTVAGLDSNGVLCRLEAGFSYAALVETVAESPAGSWWGMDFPVGLPAEYLGEVKGLGGALKMIDQCEDAPAFRRRCAEMTGVVWPGRKELKRRCDREKATPFAVSNLRMFRQTYFGMRDVIGPLFRMDQVAVLPWESWDDDEKIRVFETCPASLLKERGQYVRYKGRSAEARAGRMATLAFMQAEGMVIGDVFRDRLVADREGDLIDAVLCAWTGALLDRDRERLCELCEIPEALTEGWVFL